MISITTVTQKGQITIPVAMRIALGINPYDRVQVRMGDGVVEIEPTPDFLSMAGSVKPIKGKSALKAREYMEKHYKRK